jgi:acetyl-CoA carboxylase biotin carboxyl carrier protein
VEPKQIRELIELISRSEFSEFEMEREGFKLKLVRHPAVTTVVPAAPIGAPQVVAGVAVTEAPQVLPLAESAQESPSVDDGLVDFNSPIVGTFYRSPGPDQSAFVEVGSKVKKGQTLCIVEAMKVMNEIDSEIDAEVVDVPVANGQPVEYGEVLFRLRPLN